MARKTLYFNSYCNHISAAIVEDGKLTEYFFEQEDQQSIVGNIYKGKVTNVLSGMDCAFINCGLERNCYIPTVDQADIAKYDGTSVEPTRLHLQVGDEILVQVVKAPVGKKGAKVTTNLSLIGKTLIYMPTTEFIGVSRKITDEELRKNLIFMADHLKKKHEGLIVRTAAPYATRGQMVDELKYLRNVHTNLLQRAKKATAGTLIYSDDSLPVRILRDTLSTDIEKIIVGNEQLGEAIKNMISLYPPRSRNPVEIRDTQRDLFEEAGILDQIRSLFQPRVRLENGAELVIEHTEALTVIDVNTSKFIGDDSLEQTVYHANLSAAREIARQVRMRNIGGIIVVDFIDMNHASHQKALVEELEHALAADKAKCTVLPMSKFGLVEFTRKRISPATYSYMMKECKRCNGLGYTPSPAFLLFSIRAKLLNLLANGNGTIIVDINNDIANEFLRNDVLIADIQNRFPSARIYLVPHRTYAEMKYTFRCEGEGKFSIPEGSILLF